MQTRGFCSAFKIQTFRDRESAIESETIAKVSCKSHKYGERLI